LNHALPDALFTLAPIYGVQEIDLDAMNPWQEAESCRSC